MIAIQLDMIGSNQNIFSLLLIIMTQQICISELSEFLMMTS